jgi:hypothetical protein
MRSIVAHGAVVLLSCFLASNAKAQFLDFHGKVDPSWTGPTFKLSQNYPNSSAQDQMPWKSFDFHTQPRDYLYTVLAYVLDGNIDVDWRIQDNPKRKWYHVPWMEWDTYGREYVRGLTRERSGKLVELTGTGNPATTAQSWAVGFYNSPGGYTIGQVWKNPNQPDPSVSQFPEGTVVAKLLFTQFDETTLPFLRGSLVWPAAIHKDPTCTRLPPLADGSDPPKCVRMAPKDVHLYLLQVDVAIKDNRAGKSGWIFGTFTYNGNLTSDQSNLLPSGPPWNRLVPVGLMWGNDPQLVPGSGASPNESITLDTGLFEHLGCAKRLVGPIDNPVSACISCHMQAQFPVSPKSIVPAKCDSAPQNMSYFQNLSPTDVFDPSVQGAVALDFSLQMQYGIRAFHLANPAAMLANKAPIDKQILLRSLTTLNR